MRRPNESWASYNSRLCKIVDEIEKDRKDFLHKFNLALEKSRKAKAKLNPDAKTKAKKENLFKNIN